METNTYFINTTTGEVTFNYNEAIKWNERDKAEVDVHVDGEYAYTWLVMG